MKYCSFTLVAFAILSIRLAHPADIVATSSPASNAELEISNDELRRRVDATASQLEASIRMIQGYTNELRQMSVDLAKVVANERAHAKLVADGKATPIPKRIDCVDPNELNQDSIRGMIDAFHIALRELKAAQSALKKSHDAEQGAAANP